MLKPNPLYLVCSGTVLHTHVWARAKAVGVTIGLEVWGGAISAPVITVKEPPAASLSGKVDTSYQLFNLVSPVSLPIYAMDQGGRAGQQSASDLKGWLCL
jgi:hypothetical protein